MTDRTNSSEAIRDAWDARVDAYADSLAEPSLRGLAAEIELAAFELSLPGEGGLDLLDAGCGVGFHGNRLLAKGHRVTFADVSPRMLERAREQARPAWLDDASFIECDIRDMAGIGDRSFDGIVSGGTVVSDCGDPRRAMRELARVLRPGGTIGFSVRNLDGPQQKGPRQEVMRGGGPGFDWWFFSPESAAEICEGSGLTFRRAYPVLMESVPASDVEGRVRYHLEAAPVDDWRGRAWEMFVIAQRPQRTERSRQERCPGPVA